MRCPVSVYAFPGFTTFLEAAARRIGHPEAEAPARRIATLSALANLCAQAGASSPDDAREILAKAAEFRDQLHAAYVAAELMLSDVSGALGMEEGVAGTDPDSLRKKKPANRPVASPKNSPAS